MIIIPKEKPVVENLNSFYLKLDKLLEHFRGELESGGIYFYSPKAEAVVFFDDENLLNGFYHDRKEQVDGQVAVDRIFQTASQSNFSVSVYRIQPDRLYYWANLANSKILYRDLSSEFADLESLLKKMENEKLTGFIDVQLKPNSEQGLLFFHNGQLLGGASSSGKGRVDRSSEYRDDLIKRCREHGGTFNVHKTDLSVERAAARASDTTVKAPPANPSAAAEPAPEPVKDPSLSDSERVVQMLQDLLAVLEMVVREDKKHRSEFDTLLNRKFMEKVDRYEFLDPFAAEFKYAKGSLEYDGNAPPEKLVEGVVECTREIVSELGVSKKFHRYLASWNNVYGDEIDAYRIDI